MPVVTRPAVLGRHLLLDRLPSALGTARDATALPHAHDADGRGTAASRPDQGPTAKTT
jgi:hypothetical protein